MRCASLFVALLACGSPDSPGVDASTDTYTAPESAGGPCGLLTFQCCAYCDDDVVQAPVCTNNAWTCPSGSVSSTTCRAQNPCEIPCSLPSDLRCVTCADGGVFDAICDFDAATYGCPSGAQLGFGPQATCTDASAD